MKALYYSDPHSDPVKIKIPNKSCLDLTYENYRMHAVCAKCGARLDPGSTYQSEKIFDEIGCYPYLVCRKCHKEEINNG